MSCTSGPLDRGGTGRVDPRRLGHRRRYDLGHLGAGKQHVEDRRIDPVDSTKYAANEIKLRVMFQL